MGRLAYMNIFNFKKSYLGVDLGTSSIKMVELQNKGGRALLLTYGYVEQPTDIIRSSSIEMEEKIINIIKAIYEQSRMSSKKVVAALPSFSVFNSIINLFGGREIAFFGADVQTLFTLPLPVPIEPYLMDIDITFTMVSAF